MVYEAQQKLFLLHALFLDVFLVFLCKLTDFLLTLIIASAPCICPGAFIPSLVFIQWAAAVLAISVFWLTICNVKGIFRGSLF